MFYASDLGLNDGWCLSTPSPVSAVDWFPAAVFSGTFFWWWCLPFRLAKALVHEGTTVLTSHRLFQMLCFICNNLTWKDPTCPADSFPALISAQELSWNYNF